MEALIFIVRTLLQVLLVTVFLLRVLLPMVRADSRNQMSQAVIRLTNPLVMPLRRVLPPIGKIDTASIVALLIVQSAATAVLWLLGAYPWVDLLPEFLHVALDFRGRNGITPPRVTGCPFLTLGSRGKDHVGKVTLRAQGVGTSRITVR